jgi:hypothetical protein
LANTNFPAGVGWARWSRGLVWLLLAVLLFALPLVFDRRFTEQFSYIKILLTKLTVLLGGVLWVLAALWARAARLPRSRLLLPLGLLSLAVIVSCLNSPVPAFSLRAAAYFLCGPAWFLLFLAWSDGEALVKRAAMLAVTGASAVAIIALLQWWGYDPLLWGGYRVEWGRMVARMRLYSTLGNPNFVAGYLIGVVFLAGALAAVAVKVWMKVAWSATAAVMVVAIVGTGSRGAWGGLVVGTVLAGLVVIVGKKFPSSAVATAAESHVAESSPKVKRDVRARSLVVPVALWLVLPALTRFLDAVLGRFEGRLYLWRVSWPLFAEHPLLGSGWGSFQLEFLDLQARFLAQHSAMARYWSNIGQLHNDPMQLWLETGAVGLVAFGWVLWRYGREIAEGARAAGPRAGCYWLAASAGGVAAILFDSFFNFQFSVPPTLMLLFTLLAFPAALARDISGKGDSDPRAGEWDNSILSSARSRWYLLAGRVLLSLILLASGGAFVRQTLHYAQAEYEYKAALDFERNGNLAAAEQASRQGLALDPLNGRLHFGLARALHFSGQSAGALAETLRAERTYRDSHIEMLKGHILDTLGARRPALQTFRHALALDPTLKTVQADIQRLEADSRAR